jgi:hypothetical protein
MKRKELDSLISMTQHVQDCWDTFAAIKTLLLDINIEKNEANRVLYKGIAQLVKVQRDKLTFDD